METIESISAYQINITATARILKIEKKRGFNFGSAIQRKTSSNNLHVKHERAVGRNSLDIDVYFGIRLKKIKVVLMIHVIWLSVVEVSSGKT